MIHAVVSAIDDLGGAATVDAFLALMIGAIGVGLAAGLGGAGSVAAFAKGFGDTMGGVGILIGLGAMYGKLLADSGGADRIVDTLITPDPESDGLRFPRAPRTPAPPAPRSPTWPRPSPAAAATATTPPPMPVPPARSSLEAINTANTSNASSIALPRNVRAVASNVGAPPAAAAK
jgi:hypothetical protein